MGYWEKSAMGTISSTLILMVFACWVNCKSSSAFGTFGFDVHHRYSDTVEDFLSLDGLPEKGSLDYYAALAHRDRLFKGRHLAGGPVNQSILTFAGGNETQSLRSFGFLHYSLVTVGTPPLSFLVALDTGSDLFWLPCDCTDCPRRITSNSGQVLDLNIYSPSASRTSTPVPCNSTACGRRQGCAESLDACAYQEVYLSDNTSTRGILVDDVLHLAMGGDLKRVINVPITLGCGMIQTGDFLDAAAINGLLGLGMDNVSVPSILANRGLASNSFSMCFGSNGLGRIDFGDKGAADQKTTPFNLQHPRAAYNITVTQIVVGDNLVDSEFTAIFDSGTSFTYFNDPAYSIIVESFNSQIVNEPRYIPTTEMIFDYCYELNETQDSYFTPNLNLTMQGGDQMFVKAPTIVIPRPGGYAYCLAVVKSDNINIIGQNFMTGYRIVFDRERNVFGWKDSDCSDSVLSMNGSSTLPVPENRNHLSPPSNWQPEKTPTYRNLSPFPSPTPQTYPLDQAAMSNRGTLLDSIATKLLFSVVTIHLLILSS